VLFFARRSLQEAARAALDAAHDGLHAERVLRGAPVGPGEPLCCWCVVCFVLNARLRGVARPLARLGLVGMNGFADVRLIS
jgi:hypothetical protein